MTIDDDDGEGMPGFGIGDLLSQVQQMQEMLVSAQAEAADSVVEGQAGDGAVRVEVSGGLEFKSVSIDPQLLVDADASLLEDLVLAALHDAMARVNELNLSAMEHTGLPEIAGFDLGDLGFGPPAGGHGPALGTDGEHGEPGD